MTQSKAEAKKRGQYQMKECPYCHGHFRNVKNHIKLKHPNEAVQDGRTAPAPEPIITKESLFGQEKPEKSEAPTMPEDNIYYCQSCRAKLRKGENPCWNCGESLLWEGID